MSEKIIKYRQLNKNLSSQIEEDRKNNVKNKYAFNDENAVRRDLTRDKSTLLRPPFLRDIDKVLHLSLYNRYADKTQVFSFFENDDITRRGLHVQIVSHIARNIGRMLGLNLDLIEAIALSHDIGHTPFGHAGENFLSELFNKETGKHFHHNVHSVRVLDGIFKRNLTLQTLDGVLCHNGEIESIDYVPVGKIDFKTFDNNMQMCYKEKHGIEKVIPSTLEGCVVRVADMLAYLGKDRQDALKAKIIDNTDMFTKCKMGEHNATIINNFTIDIIENSYGKNSISFSNEAFSELSLIKQENYKYIYKNDAILQKYEKVIKPMFKDVYYKLLEDLTKKKRDSYIFKHHIDFVNGERKYYSDEVYENEEPNQIVVDYIASQTDDYFIALHKKLFPKSNYKIEYKSYFTD